MSLWAECSPLSSSPFPSPLPLAAAVTAQSSPSIDAPAPTSSSSGLLKSTDIPLSSLRGGSPAAPSKASSPNFQGQIWGHPDVQSLHPFMKEEVTSRVESNLGVAARIRAKYSKSASLLLQPPSSVSSPRLPSSTSPRYRFPPSYPASAGTEIRGRLPTPSLPVRLSMSSCSWLITSMFVLSSL